MIISGFFPDSVHAGITGRRSPAWATGTSYSPAAVDSPRIVSLNRAILAARIGAAPGSLLWLTQVHSAGVVRRSGNERTDADSYREPEADAHWTTADNAALCLSVADCAPVLAFFPDSNVVAAAHCGRRGTELNLVGVLFEEIREKTSSDVSLAYVWIGPCAGADRYEIGFEAAKPFIEMENRYPGSIRATGTDRYLLDLRAVLHRQCIEAGAVQTRIRVDDRCTITDATLHSYRRDGIRSGRMAAWIVRG